MAILLAAIALKPLVASVAVTADERYSYDAFSSSGPDLKNDLKQVSDRGAEIVGFTFANKIVGYTYIVKVPGAPVAPNVKK